MCVSVQGLGMVFPMHDLRIGVIIHSLQVGAALESSVFSGIDNKYSLKTAETTWFCGTCCM